LKGEKKERRHLFFHVKPRISKSREAWKRKRRGGGQRLSTLIYSFEKEKREKGVIHL